MTQTQQSSKLFTSDNSDSPIATQWLRWRDEAIGSDKNNVAKANNRMENWTRTNRSRGEDKTALGSEASKQWCLQLQSCRNL